MKEILKWAFQAVIWVILTGLVTNKIYHVLFQAPELSYVTRTYSLFPGIKSNDAIVKLFVNDEQVETLYMTTIRLENSGGIALERNDFAAERDPLRITGQNIKSVFIDDTNSRYNSETNVNENAMNAGFGIDVSSNLVDAFFKVKDNGVAKDKKWGFAAGTTIKPSITRNEARQ